MQRGKAATVDATKKSGGRYALLDELRGLSLIAMIGYHGMWDLVYLAGIRAAWYEGLPGRLWQQTVCCIFILLSGFCLALGHAPVRRGLIVFGGGALVTLVTWAVLPEDIVLFGVLTFLGSAMIFTGLLRPWLDRVPGWAGLAGSILLFLLTYHVNAGYLSLGGLYLGQLPDSLYANLLTAYLGFPGPGFYSTDYFSLIPWLFLFWAGFYLYKVVGRPRMEPLRRSICPPLGWIGRHSLVIYMLHQPVLYGLLMVWNALH